jgi:hypothetical protein
MTPKEKAKELFDKMYGVTDYQAKQSALIAVDEILSWNQTKFWEDVKQEIEKL